MHRYRRTLSRLIRQEIMSTLNCRAGHPIFIQQCTFNLELHGKVLCRKKKINIKTIYK